MRLIILMISLSLLASCGDSSKKKTETKQTSDTIAKKDSSTTNPVAETTTAALSVEQIREEYKRINSLKLKKKEYHFACTKDPGEGPIAYYLENDKVVKITIDRGVIGDYLYMSEYYFKDGKLIFIYDYINGGPANNEPATTTEERSYVSNDKVIKFMENQKEIACTTCEFPTGSQIYLIYNAYNTNDVTKAVCDE